MANIGVDLSGLIELIAQKREESKKRQISQILNKALTTNNPDDITQALQTLADVSPEVHAQIAPKLIERQQALQLALTSGKTIADSLLKQGLPDTLVKPATDMLQTNPEQAIQLLTKLYLDYSGAINSAVGQTTGHLLAQTSPLGIKAKELEIAMDVKQAKELMPVQLELFDKQQRILLERQKELEAYRHKLQTQELAPQVLMQTRDTYYKELQNAGKRLEELNKNIQTILNDPEFLSANDMHTFSFGERDTASIYSGVREIEQAKTLKENKTRTELDLYREKFNAPNMTENDVRQMKEIYNNTERLPQNIRQKFETYIQNLGEAQLLDAHFKNVAFQATQADRLVFNIDNQLPPKKREDWILNRWQTLISQYGATTKLPPVTMPVTIPEQPSKLGNAISGIKHITPSFTPAPPETARSMLGGSKEIPVTQPAQQSPADIENEIEQRIQALKIIAPTMSDAQIQKIRETLRTEKGLQ